MKWFGKDDEESKGKILERMRRTLKVCKELRIENFNSLNDGEKGEKDYGLVYPWDRNHKVFLGAKFWEVKERNANNKAGVIIHELSHFRDIGNTDDITYGERGCLELAQSFPKEAMINADSFEYFIKDNIV